MGKRILCVAAACLLAVSIPADAAKKLKKQAVDKVGFEDRKCLYVLEFHLQRKIRTCRRVTLERTLSLRCQGTKHISLPCKKAQEAFDWWPRFTTDKFSDPLSLYQCQFENRHAK